MESVEKRPFLDARTLILVMILPLLAGILIASFIPQPKVGVIEIKDPLDNQVGKAVVEQIQYAYNHPEIKAVVMVLDCPGGTINDTELIYLELNHLRKKKPVVTMVQGLSASGAFYISMATDYIYSNPSAMVGNVGVIGQIPPVPIILEETYSTGPYKFWGSARDTYVRQIDMMMRSFLKAVEVGRGDRLVIPLERVSRGEIYPATEALSHGLIDALGSQSEAIGKAAQLAHIANYEVLDLGQLVEKAQSEEEAFYAVDDQGQITGYPKETGFYFLYIANTQGGLR
jgi:protease-4